MSYGGLAYWHAQQFRAAALESLKQQEIALSNIEIPGQGYASAIAAATVSLREARSLAHGKNQRNRVADLDNALLFLSVARTTAYYSAQSPDSVSMFNALQDYERQIGNILRDTQAKL
jgi:hypothetical protein